MKSKIGTFIANGSTYAVAVDPYGLEIFATGTRPEGFAFDVDRIADA